jgi:hypothetical protein
MSPCRLKVWPNGPNCFNRTRPGQRVRSLIIALRCEGAVLRTWAAGGRAIRLARPSGRDILPYVGLEDRLGGAPGVA